MAKLQQHFILADNFFNNKKSNDLAEVLHDTDENNIDKKYFDHRDASKYNYEYGELFSGARRFDAA